MLLYSTPATTACSIAETCLSRGIAKELDGAASQATVFPVKPLALVAHNGRYASRSASDFRHF